MQSVGAERMEELIVQMEENEKRERRAQQRQWYRRRRSQMTGNEIALHNERRRMRYRLRRLQKGAEHAMGAVDRSPTLHLREGDRRTNAGGVVEMAYQVPMFRLRERSPRAKTHRDRVMEMEFHYPMLHVQEEGAQANAPRMVDMEYQNQMVRLHGVQGPSDMEMAYQNPLLLVHEGSTQASTCGMLEMAFQNRRLEEQRTGGGSIWMNGQHIEQQTRHQAKNKRIQKKHWRWKAEARKGGAKSEAQNGDFNFSVGIREAPGAVDVHSVDSETTETDESLDMHQDRNYVILRANQQSDSEHLLTGDEVISRARFDEGNSKVHKAAAGEGTSQVPYVLPGKGASEIFQPNSSPTSGCHKRFASSSCHSYNKNRQVLVNRVHGAATSYLSAKPPSRMVKICDTAG